MQMSVTKAVISQIQSSLNGKVTGEAKYLRLQTIIGELVAQGRVLPGQRLPADKPFADMIGISLGTVQKALINLQKQGVVDRAPKRGTVIAEHLVDEGDIYVFRFRDDAGELIKPQVRMISIAED